MHVNKTIVVDTLYIVKTKYEPNGSNPKNKEKLYEQNQTLIARHKILLPTQLQLVTISYNLRSSMYICITKKVCKIFKKIIQIITQLKMGKFYPIMNDTVLHLIHLN